MRAHANQRMTASTRSPSVLRQVDTSARSSMVVSRMAVVAGLALVLVSKPESVRAEDRVGLNAELDLPDAGIGGERARPAAGILRAPDLAREPIQVRRGRSSHTERSARAGHRAVHAGNRRRAGPARSVRSGTGTAEVGRVPARAARAIWQSRARRRSLQRGAAARAGLAERNRRHAARDARLRRSRSPADRSTTGSRSRADAGPRAPLAATK